jgi:uncharacterized surface protein with fasciclin (FAS1) repeats
MTAPEKPAEDKTPKPPGPSSTLPSVPNQVSVEPPATPSSPGSASELSAPAMPSTPSTDGVPKPAEAGSPPSVPEAPATETTSPTTPPSGPSSEAPTSGGNVVEVVGADAKLKTLASAIKAAGLDEALAAKGPFTIFAPTDEAFAALPPEALKDLLKPENKAKLAQLLTYHVVSGKMDSKTLKPGETATVQGQPLTIKVDGSKVMVNDATVTQADVGASNGVIHLIDKVILPPAAG